MRWLLIDPGLLIGEGIREFRVSLFQGVVAALQVIQLLLLICKNFVEDLHCVFQKRQFFLENP